MAALATQTPVLDEQFNQLANNIRDVLWLYAADFSAVIYISPAYERVWGRTLESLRKDPYSFLEAVHPEDRARVEKVVRNERDHGFNLQYRIIKPDGDVRWIWDRGVPVKDANGRVYRVAGIAEDITERRKADEELRRVSERLQLATTAASMGIWDWDIARDAIVWDDQMYRLYGIRREESGPVFEVWTKSLAPEDLDRANAELQEALQGEGAFSSEFRILWPDGSSHFIRAASQTFRDEEGRPARMVGLNYDITERKQAEERISLLQTITMDVAAVEDLSSALEVVLRRVCEKTGWALGQAWIPRRDGTGLDCCPTWFATDPTLETFRDLSRDVTLAPGAGLPGRVYVSKQPAWIRDVTQDPNFPRVDAARKAGLKGALAVPILSSDAVIAVLEFFLSEPREEDDRLVKVIAAVAAQIGQVIERKHAEQQLRWSEERLRLLLDSTAEGIFGVDLQGRCTFCNASSLRLLGYDRPSEILGQEMHGLIASRRADGSPYPPEECPVVQSLRTAKNVFMDQDVFWRKDGTNFPAAYWSYPIFHDGTHIGAVLTFLDITERKLADESLRLSEERFVKAFQGSPEPNSIDRHRDGVILEVNERWQSIYGYSRDEVVGRTAMDLDLIPPEILEEIRGLLEKQRSLRDFEVDLKTKANEIRNVSLSAEQIVINNELCNIFLHRDITERRKAEEGLRASTDQLRALSSRLQRAKEEQSIRIAREIHDELGSQLTSLRWELEGLAKASDPEVRTKVNGMLELADTTIGIVRRIASELRPPVLDVLGLAEAIQWHAQQFQERTGITVHLESHADVVHLSQEQSLAVFRIFRKPSRTSFATHMPSEWT
jgi:PAS domain S-box-containing protein